MKKLLLRLFVGVFVVWADSAIVAYFGRVEPLSYWVTVYIFCIPFTYALDGLAYLWRGLTKRAADAASLSSAETLGDNSRRG